MSKKQRSIKSKMNKLRKELVRLTVVDPIFDDIKNIDRTTAEYAECRSTLIERIAASTGHTPAEVEKIRWPEK